MWQLMNRNLTANIFWGRWHKCAYVVNSITSKNRWRQIHFNSNIPCTCSLLSGLVLPWFTTKITYTYFAYPLPATCYTYLTHLHFITHSSVSSCTAHPNYMPFFGFPLLPLLKANLLLSTLLPVTHNSSTSPYYMTASFTPTYRKTDKISLIFLFLFLDVMRKPESIKKSPNCLVVTSQWLHFWLITAIPEHLTDWHIFKWFIS
jgi:hypothetical protein